MRSFFSLVLLTYFSIVSLQAQDPFSTVDLLHPDHSQLEILTFRSVNGLREEKKLNGLIWDDVLKRAAQDHADYLIKEKKIGHYQTVKGKKTPADRVKIHGGLIYTVIGENIVEFPLGVYLPVMGIKRSTVTYQSSAITMAQLWKSSPGHYKNIISPAYNCTAIAVSYDPLKQRLIAVQVFAYSSTPSAQINLPDNSQLLLSYPEEELPHKLKKYKYKAGYKKAIPAFMKLRMEQGFLIGSYKEAKKVFKGRRTGISQEFIPLTQFDSASKEFSSVPNRRNGVYELNGQLSKPVYRRKLLKYSRQHSLRHYYIYTRFIRIKKRTTQFIYPLLPNDNEKAFNLFLVKSKRLVTYRSYINIPAALFDDKFPKLKSINSFKAVKAEKKFRIYHSYDTLQYKIFYTPGAITIEPEKMEEIKSSMALKTGKIVAVEAAAYASIEGDKKDNDKLARNRMEQFMLLIRPYKDSMLASPKIKTREQWEFFYKQIKGTPLEGLKKMNIVKLRSYVNDHKKDSVFIGLLNEQRYMLITMIWKNDHKEYLPTKTSVQIYDSLQSRIGATDKPGLDLLNAFEKAQLSMYYEISRDDSNSIKLPIIPYMDRYPVFEYHQLIFQYQVMKNLGDKEFYWRLHSLAKSKYFPDRLKNQAIYTNLVFLYDQYLKGDIGNYIDYYSLPCYKYRQSEFHLRNFKKLKCRTIINNYHTSSYFVLKEIPAFITKGKGMKLPEFPENDLWKYYYLYTIHSLASFVPIHQEIYSLLPGIKKYYHPVDSILTEEERLKLAYFYCLFYKYEMAKKLVEPLAIRAEPNKEALKLYLCLRYEDFEEVHEFTDMLIKEFPRLGKEEWCDLWFNPGYLNFLLLEDLKLKNFYNCNCDR